MSMLAFIQNLSMWELLIILAIGLLLFGKRLPEVGRGLGKSIVEFKRGLKTVEEDVDTEVSRREAKERDAASNQRAIEERAYKAPVTEGIDQRVSRADTIEEVPARPPTPSVPQ
ncbi:MAG: twin-arginine translocase TatA/TatE family subunit [Planctomycetota bacterium]|nr:twin-arginine translocase TatA/TatE family subunit [Planctomycetota bacterium]